MLYDMPFSCMHSFIFLYATINDMRNLLQKYDIEGYSEIGIPLRFTHPFMLTKQPLSSNKGIP